jgi:hypothetical protein
MQIQMYFFLLVWVFLDFALELVLLAVAFVVKFAADGAFLLFNWRFR